ncbi:oligopeptide/dipeptide ABC transporter transmembrane protein [Streptomyces albus]|uniref:Oligopeptide/dipeptide ABC transporter transmembrane protein n=1 Tax=Streptomyces albus (strain ATCC 21838 / DSM 41398 / FERM P-419 / JCM 4703 / NBRC 107858) TaxID=1081613 RepID=A0A0B5EZT1_STRA4|nr:oligopeptide/dipeptide ABC transporter transmembrane protein [Streptomyces albus]AOU78436.1 oligopeptide/dipeptide ABC transporter transmembrane protein [Streptomyces albus]AYN34184.1 ABC transporter permease [Streptomyces albus]
MTARYLLRRALSLLVTLLLASVAIFGLLRLVPGSTAAAVAGADASPEQLAAIEADLGLHRPLPAQYGSWLHGILTGDLEKSYVLGRPIGELIRGGLGATLQLTLAAGLIAAVLGFLLGVLAATARNRLVRGAAKTVTTLALAVPPYASGTVLIAVFAVALPVLPPGGHASLAKDPDLAVQFLLLPAVCLALPVAAVLARFLADGLQSALGEDYTRAAAGLGVRRRRLILRHALPNALAPVITVAAVQVGNLLAGSAIVEALFAWPGLGQLLIQSIVSHDLLVVQDLLLLAVAAFVVLQLLGEAARAWLDPRIALRGAS